MAGENEIVVLTKTIGALREQISAIDARFGKIEAIHDARDGRSASYIVDEDAEPRIKGYNPHRRQRLVYPEGYRPRSLWKTFGHFLQEGLMSHVGAQANAQTKFDFASRYNSIVKTVQGMSTGVGADGGFTVLPEFSPDIHDRVYDNDLISRIDSFTVNGNRMAFPCVDETSRATGSRAGGLQAYWVDEGGTMTGSKPKLKETELKLKKLCVIVYLTEELITDNSYALQQWVTRKVSEEINFMIGNSIINGKGGGAPLGILNSPNLITVTKDASQAADTISPGNITNMWARRLANTPRDGWVWLMHQSSQAALQLMTITNGATAGLVYMPPTGLAGAPYATLQGLPIVDLEFCPTLGDHGDIILANLREYVSITKGGIAQSQSTEVEFLTDQLALKFTLRFDGRPYDNAAITPFQAGATAAPTQSAFIIVEDR